MSIPERPPESSSSAPPSVPPGSFVNAPYWIIVGGAAGGGLSRGSRNRRITMVEVLSLDLADGRVLPVFGSEESAARFARAWTANAVVTDPAGGDPGRGKASMASTGGVEGKWQPRGTGAGELISLLSGSAFSAAPCAGVERVTIDPPPELIDGIRHGLTEGHVGELISMNRRCFLERLMGRGRSWFENKAQTESS